MGVAQAAALSTTAVAEFGRVWLGALGHRDRRAWLETQPQVVFPRLLRAAGVRLETSGLEHVPDGPFLLAPNHQGNLDIPAIVAALPDHLPRFVFKQELLRIPVFGQLQTWYGNIPIDRSNRDQAVRQIRAGLDQVKGKQYLALFPEGTRTKSGIVGPAKRGVFHFARETGLPILPAAVAGSFARFPQDRLGEVNAGPLKISFLAPLLPDSYASEEDPVGQMAATWQDRVVDKVRELELALGSMGSALAWASHPVGQGT
ncbi:MAG: lysophospholipid acyltransferase family protein [Candidatus Sericytochromatia bacterium]|nr:lysophospholipid acyltransferase family protein [Candidatus Sericytochromatia bacterium]